MERDWYYVQENKRMGPIREKEMEGLFKRGTLNAESYIWFKGLNNWKKAVDVEEVAPYLFSANTGDDPWNIKENEQIITIKVGHDRGKEEAEYGPYTLAQIRRAFGEKRINGKTFVFVPGASKWEFLAETPLFSLITNDVPPIISEKERRGFSRRPFVAKLLFHDQVNVFEGVCRDISVGGMQVLVSNFPAKVGDFIKMNVHPENEERSFSASGRIVRSLHGNQGFSLRFEGLDEEAKSLIENYVRRGS